MMQALTLEMRNLKALAQELTPIVSQAPFLILAVRAWV